MNFGIFKETNNENVQQISYSARNNEQLFFFVYELYNSLKKNVCNGLPPEIENIDIEKIINFIDDI